MTLSDRLREEGRIAGEREAFRLGYVDGLLIQVPLRFGPLPEAAVARLRSAELAQLDRWAERVLTAATLEEFFDDA